MTEPIKHINRKGKVLWQPRTQKGAVLCLSILDGRSHQWYYNHNTNPILMSRWRAKFLAWCREYREILKADEESFRRVDNGL